MILSGIAEVRQRLGLIYAKVAGPGRWAADPKVVSARLAVHGDRWVRAGPFPTLPYMAVFQCAVRENRLAFPESMTGDHRRVRLT
jgi:hypothetical protein